MRGGALAFERCGVGCWVGCGGVGGGEWEGEGGWGSGVEDYSLDIVPGDFVFLGSLGGAGGCSLVRDVRGWVYFRSLGGSGWREESERIGPCLWVVGSLHTVNENRHIQFSGALMKLVRKVPLNNRPELCYPDHRVQIWFILTAIHICRVVTVRRAVGYRTEP